MIFQCKDHITWDTWMFYYENTYYLYYLITDHSGGEGFGVAVSQDGVHYRDQGTCITASEQMVIYLGTGAVWKSPYFEEDKTFICNYSEWREEASTGKRFQSIYFATSTDLIHWTKRGDSEVFSVDESRYARFEEDGGRWDCIFPHCTAHGYEGFFTATPKQYLGCGYATSADGLHWQAQTPPEFSLCGREDIKECVEAGAVCVHNGRYYMLMGTYLYRYGMSVIVSDRPNGIYTPQKKCFSLLSNNSFMHAYFMRVVDVDGEKYVNHHVLLRQTNVFGRNITLAAPLKAIDFDDEGILRLKWACVNEKMKGEKIASFDFQQGFVLEFEITRSEEIFFYTESGTVVLRFGFENCSLQILEDGVPVEEISKDLRAEKKFVRILYRETLLEAYFDDYFLTCYTFSGNVYKVTNENEQNIWRICL